MSDYVAILGNKLDRPTMRVRPGATPQGKIQAGSYGQSISANYMVDYMVLDRRSEPQSAGWGQFSLFSFRIGSRDMNVHYLQGSASMTKSAIPGATHLGGPELFGKFYKNLAGLSMSFNERNPVPLDKIRQKIERNVNATDFNDPVADLADAFLRSVPNEKRDELFSELVSDVKKIGHGELNLAEPHVLATRGKELVEKYRGSKRIRTHEQPYFSLLNHTLFSMVHDNDLAEMLHTAAKQVRPEYKPVGYTQKFLAMNLRFPAKAEFIKGYYDSHCNDR